MTFLYTLRIHISCFVRYLLSFFEPVVVTPRRRREVPVTMIAPAPLLKPVPVTPSRHAEPSYDPALITAMRGPARPLGIDLRNRRPGAVIHHRLFLAPPLGVRPELN
jgi:hypothetical protein